jgi:hypothetical protein
VKFGVDVGSDDVVVIVGAGAGVADCFVVAVVVTSSLQPNQPGVLHVDVELVLVEVDIVDSVVVDSSRHPHHPGVLQVSVLVRLVEVVLGTVTDVVVDSVPLLS